MKIEFKTLEYGWALRSFRKSICFVFTNPIHLFIILLGFISLSYTDFMLIYILFIAFSFSYSYFYQEKNDSNFFFNKLFIKTLFNSFKQQRDFYSFLFITIAINFINLVFFNPDNITSKDEVETTTNTLFYSYLILIFFFLIIFFFITSFFFKTSIFYYFLMKSNNIFYNFSSFDRNFSKYISNYYSEIGSKNKYFYIKFISSSLIIFFGFMSLFLILMYLTHPLLFKLFFPTSSFVVYGYCFFITEELIDGKKNDVKIKVLKKVESN